MANNNSIRRLDGSPIAPVVTKFEGGITKLKMALTIDVLPKGYVVAVREIDSSTIWELCDHSNSLHLIRLFYNKVKSQIQATDWDIIDQQETDHAAHTIYEFKGAVCQM